MYTHYIDGDLVESTSKRTIDVIDPATQDVIATVLAGPSINRASTHIALSTPVSLRTAPLVAAAATAPDGA